MAMMAARALTHFMIGTEKKQGKLKGNVVVIIHNLENINFKNGKAALKRFLFKFFFATQQCNA